VIILKGGIRVGYSVALKVLIVAEALGVPTNVTLDLVPVAMHFIIIDVEVVYVTRFYRLLPFEHGIVWILLFPFILYDLSLSRLRA
jgi:hypothetical protein